MTKLMLLVFTVSVSAFADVKIDDKANFMAHFEEKLSTKTFKDLHACDLNVTYSEPVEGYEIQCFDDGLGWSCFSGTINNGSESTKTIQSCNDKEQIVFSDKGTLETFTVEDFKAKKGNYVKGFLTKLDSYIGYKIKLTLLSYAPAEMTIGTGTANERKIKVINVKAKADFLEKPYDVYSEDIILSVSPDVQGTIQILRFRMGAENWVRVLNF